MSCFGFSGHGTSRSIQRLGPQPIVQREVEHEIVRQRLDVMQAAIDDHALEALVHGRQHIGRIAQVELAGAGTRATFLAGPEGRHHPRQTFGPVTGTEAATLMGLADDDEAGRMTDMRHRIGRSPRTGRRDRVRGMGRGVGRRGRNAASECLLTRDPVADRRGWVH